jgi:hypothetical protein
MWDIAAMNEWMVENENEMEEKKRTMVCLFISCCGL